MLEMLLMMAALFAVMYFLLIRPQKKRMEQHQQMQAALQPGERVLLTSGIFGTIVHTGEKQLIVELAPGLEVTVLKGNVAQRVTPDDEEFEFTEDTVPASSVEDAPQTTDGDFSGQFDDLRPEDFQRPDTPDDHRAGDK
jgi:preprotein translocase subunit YajC